MNSASPNLTSQFASADFPDAMEVQPSDTLFDFGGLTHAAPFQTAVSNLITRNVSEMKDNNHTRTLSMIDASKLWKRRMREFVLEKANKLLEHVGRPLNNHPTLSRAEYMIRRFGRKPFDPHHPSLRDIVLDISGENMLEQINKDLDRIQTPGMRGFSEKTQYVFEQYRQVGEQILRLEEQLSIRLSIIDKVQERIGGITELQANEQFQPLAEAMEKYLEKIFDDNMIDQLYDDILRAYRKFLVLRELILMRRAPEMLEATPQCIICCDEPVLFTLVPCGHCFCQKCLQRQIGQCYVCRTQVKDRIRIYFG
jgi:hypothetical protein